MDSGVQRHPTCASHSTSTTSHCPKTKLERHVVRIFVRFGRIRRGGDYRMLVRLLRRGSQVFLLIEPRISARSLLDPNAGESASSVLSGEVLDILDGNRRCDCLAVGLLLDHVHTGSKVLLNLTRDPVLRHNPLIRLTVPHPFREALMQSGRHRPSTSARLQAIVRPRLERVAFVEHILGRFPDLRRGW